MRKAQDGLSGISRSVGGLERHMRESSNQITNLRNDFSAGESRIDRDISNITNDIVELSENQERDSRNILHTASVITGLENSIEVQRRRNTQLGDVVEKIGSMAKKPSRPSRKQIEKDEWDQLHSKIQDPEISNLDILRDHFSLIAMNRQFCLALFKSIRANSPTMKEKQPPAPISQFSASIRSDLRRAYSTLKKRFI